MCPFLEDSDPRCAVHLSLHSLEDALGWCACHYEHCPIYSEKLHADARSRPQADKHFVAAG